MRHYGDSTRYPPGLMTWNIGHPNQLFYFLACALAFVLPVDTACKVVVASSVAAVPLATGRLADHVGVSRWVAVLVAPLALGFFFYFGFVGNLLSLGLLIAVAPALDRFAHSPTTRGAGVVTLVLLLLYEAHESAMAVGGLAIVVFSVGRRVPPAANAWRAAPLAVAASVAVAAQAYAIKHVGSNLRVLPRLIDLALWQKVDEVPQALLGLHGSRTTCPTFFVIAAVVAVLASRRVRATRAITPAGSARAWIDEHRFEILGLVLIASYFEVPFSVTGAMWLHARFLTPGVAFLVVGLAPRLPSPFPVAARLGSTFAVVAVLALVGPEVAATGALYSDLDSILTIIAPGSAVAPLDVSGGPRRSLVFTVAGAAARASAERGGRMAASFTQSSPIPPVIIAPDRRWEDAVSRMAVDSTALEPAFDLRRFRYVLAWIAPGQRGEDVARAITPEARLVARSGGWWLFESTELTESLLSAEPLPVHAETVRDRMAALTGGGD